MILSASSISDVTARLDAAKASGERVSGFALAGMNRVLEYTPEDMTVTVEAGMTLAELQSGLAEGGQWLPIDPPGADTLTIGALLAGNKSGPRRYAYGTIREHLLGIQVVLADGRVIKAGGKVVKNVAGYDLCKLFVGSRGTLGVIVEATFKVLPQPECQMFVKLSAPRVEELSAPLEALKASELNPIVIDICRSEQGSATLVTGFAGAREDVEWQLARAHELGLAESATLDYDGNFWREEEPPHCLSVRPSELINALRTLNGPFVARAGNGIIYHRDPAASNKPTLPQNLMHRIKEMYDPKHLLPDLPW